MQTRRPRPEQYTEPLSSCWWRPFQLLRLKGGQAHREFEVLRDPLDRDALLLIHVLDAGAASVRLLQHVAVDEHREPDTLSHLLCGI